MNSFGVPQAAPIQILSPRTDGRPDGFAVFFLWGASGELPREGHTSGADPEENAEGRKSPACPTQLSEVARELPPPQVVASE